jgi:16S rRNA G966 N2-methylase RsmD
VEKDPKMFDFIKKNAAALKIENLKIVRADIFKFMESCDEQFNFIFAGPPYALTQIDQIPVLVFERKLLTTSGWFVLEHTPRNDYKKFPFFNMQRNYGTTVFSFFINQFSTTE